MKIEIHAEAMDDLAEGFAFYERQSAGLGAYFFDSLSADIGSLLLYAGIHRMVHGSHRSMASRFPFAIYYKLEASTIRVIAVLDCRRSPSWTQRRLSGS